MAILTRKTDYALLLLTALANEPEGECARTLADRFGISRGFAANILKELAQNGLVTSQRDTKGGYTLSRPASKIGLGEVLDALEDDFRLAACCGDHDDRTNSEESGGVCVAEKVCHLRGPMNVLHRRLMEFLGSVSLADLAPPGVGQAPIERLVSLGMANAEPATR